MNNHQEKNRLASETLARLYEEQGDLDRAMEIRRVLMKPADWTVHFESMTEDDPVGGDRLDLSVDNEGRIACRWKLTAGSLQTVKLCFPMALKEHSKALTPVLRLVVVYPAGARPERYFQDVEVPAPAGGCFFEKAVSRSAWVCAAVGLRHGSGRFHPIVHTEVIHSFRGDE